MAVRLSLILLAGLLTACATPPPIPEPDCIKATEAGSRVRMMATVGQTFELSGAEADAFMLHAGAPADVAEAVDAVHGFEVVGGPIGIPNGDFILLHSIGECLTQLIVHSPRGDVEAALRYARGIRV